MKLLGRSIVELGDEQMNHPPQADSEAVIVRTSHITGQVDIPPSKSYTHRSLFCAALAQGQSEIVSPLVCDDTKATIDVLKQVGCEFEPYDEGLKVYASPLTEPTQPLFCRNSGTTLRFMTGISALIDGESMLNGKPSLSSRPIRSLVESLQELGGSCSCEGATPPVTVRGKLKGGTTSIPGNVSSQFISSLLLTAPLAKEKVKIHVTTALESQPYVEMTADTQQAFDVSVHSTDSFDRFSISPQTYKPSKYKVEGDWSSAAFFIVAGILKGDLEIKNVDLASLQADKAIVELLKSIGGCIRVDNNSLSVKQSHLRPFQVNVSNCPDLFPVLCVLAANIEGTSEISGISRLRMKESDRVEAMKEGLTALGIPMKEEEGKVSITGTTSQGGTIDPKNDHRIAMAFALMGLVSEKSVKIYSPCCVRKSFPTFWTALENIGGNIVRV